MFLRQEQIKKAKHCRNTKFKKKSLEQCIWRITFALKSRTGLCCQTWNKSWIIPGWHLRTGIKQKKQMSCWKSFEYNDVTCGSPSDPCPELTAASPIRILTMLVRFTPKKVLPLSGATPHLWDAGKAQSPTRTLQLRLPQNSIPILCEFQVSTARRSLLCTHKRERNPSTEINFWYRKMCVDVHENRKENKADPIFRSSKDTILVKNWCKTEDMNPLLSLQLVPVLCSWTKLYL